MSGYESARLIQEHLDKAANDSGYLDVINGSTPESMIDAEMKVAPILHTLAGIDLPSNVILSVGVGQGEELHALSGGINDGFYVVGLDIADSALERAVQRRESHLLDFGLIQANGTRLPFRPRSIGGIVMSSILHELYSYHQPNGYEAFQDAVGQASNTLCPGGVLYVREFACPQANNGLELVPLTKEAAEFYEFFTNNFQVGLNEQNTSNYIENGDKLSTSGEVMQLILHFRNFWNDKSKGFTQLGDLSWKELRESYSVPNPHNPEEALSPVEYCNEITYAALCAGDELTLIGMNLIDRKKTVLFLAQHFQIYNYNADDITAIFLKAATSKLEALFQKK